jgi:hypothetical protein
LILASARLGSQRFAKRRRLDARALNASLLVRRESALAWMFESDVVDAGASNFGVSVELFRWRIYRTGVMREVQKLRRGARVAG